MYYLVYKITNLINGKIYVGAHKTEDLNDGYFGSGLLLRKAIKKYGLDSFTRDILFFCEGESEMFKREAEIVDEGFCVRKDTYNLCVGGKGGWTYINRNELNKKNRHIALANISKASKGKKRPDISARMLEEYQNGRPLVGAAVMTKEMLFRALSPEANAKRSETMKVVSLGEGNSQHGKIWITNGIETRKISKNDPIPEGWRTGRKMPPHYENHQSGKTYITNGFKTIMIIPGAEIPEGWWAGRTLKKYKKRIKN